MICHIQFLPHIFDKIVWEVILILYIQLYGDSNFHADDCPLKMMGAGGRCIWSPYQ